MSKVVIEEQYEAQLANLTTQIDVLNSKKVEVLFEALGLIVTPSAFEQIRDWIMIIITVPDRQMAVQLNKMSAYIPNLKFIVDAESPLFTVRQGHNGRRVWKESSRQHLESRI